MVVFVVIIHFLVPPGTLGGGGGGVEMVQKGAKVLEVGLLPKVVFAL
jgi:hypothetical protein